MPDLSISGLPAITVPSSSYLIAVVSGSGDFTTDGITSKMTVGQVYTAVSSSVLTTINNYSVMVSGSGTCSIRGIGLANTASANYSFVGGGQCSVASGDSSFIGGGRNNTANGSNLATIVSGEYNVACGYYNSVILSGTCNIACGGFYSSILGGSCNLSSGCYSTVAGGQCNITQGNFSTIVGGCSNTACGAYSSIVGGYNNLILHNNSFAIGSNLTSSAANTTYTNNLNVSSSLVVSGSLNVSGSISSSQNLSINGIPFGVASSGLSSGNTNNSLTIGKNALANGTNALASIAIGNYAISASNWSIYDIAIGHFALQNLNDYDSADNIAIGQTTGNRFAQGIYNTMIGGHSSYNLRSGSYNTFIGGTTNTNFIATGSYNTVLGVYTGSNINDPISTTRIDNNIIIADGANNIKFWYNSGSNGIIALLDDTQITGSLNVSRSINLSGSLVSRSNITAYQSINSGGSGNFAGVYVTNGWSDNTHPSGAYNTIVGANIGLQYNQSGSYNTHFGYQAGGYATAIYANNLAVGPNALYNGSYVTDNIAIGGNAMFQVSGSNGGTLKSTYNIAIGQNTLYKASSAKNNIVLGYNAMSNLVSSQDPEYYHYHDQNIVIGYQAGSGITSGSYNTIIGGFVGSGAVTQNIILADGAGNVKLWYNSGSNGQIALQSSTQITGSVSVSNVLSLAPQSPLPAASDIPYSFAVSASSPIKPYFSDGTNWNALY